MVGRSVLGRTVALSIAVVVGGVLFSTAFPAEAQTRLYRQKIDPIFGPPLGDLYWSGDGNFTVSESCFAGASVGGWYNNFGPTGPCVGQINLLKTDIFLNSRSTLTNSVTLSFLSNPSAVRVYIDVVSATEKNVVAIAGTYNAPLETIAPWAVAAGDDAGQYSLSFNGFDNDVFRTPDSLPTGSYARLTYCGRQDGYVSDPKYDECFTSSDPNVQISLVPEPSTYMLGLASFGVLGVWARRRRLSVR
jgi:hypothetical protein